MLAGATYILFLRHKFREPNGRLALRMDSNVNDSFSVQIIREETDSTVEQHNRML
jgi:hypothetical protein